MAAISQTIERHHRPIIILLFGLIAVFLTACTFHDVLPICHYIFGCDHALHELAQLSSLSLTQFA